MRARIENGRPGFMIIDSVDTPCYRSAILGRFYTRDEVVVWSRMKSSTVVSQQRNPHVLKLYKRIDRILHYHEAWASAGEVTEHWGIVGEQGATCDHPLHHGEPASAAVQRVLAAALAEGFHPIGADDHATLLIEYPIDGMGGAADLERTHALEARLNETLGWTGLGYCDGGSIGSGTMEVCCLVVDFDVAKAVIEADLGSTEFASFSRIYQEEA